jgi:hypothetical protein
MRHGDRCARAGRSCLAERGATATALFKDVLFKDGGGGAPRRRSSIERYAPRRASLRADAAPTLKSKTLRAIAALRQPLSRPSRIEEPVAGNVAGTAAVTGHAELTDHPPGTA